MTQKSEKDYQEIFYYLNVVFSATGTIVGSVVVSGLLGFFLDKFFFKKVGFFLVIFLVLGIISGFMSAYRVILRKDFIYKNFIKKDRE
jgi:F0F1-type ATP synthase assembly protein I